MKLLDPARKIQSERLGVPLEDSISFDQDTNFRLGGDGHALTFIFGRTTYLH